MDQQYIGETVRRLETRIHEHLEACKRGELNKSAIAEHAWTNQHAILWDKTSILDKSRNQTVLRIKEALHLQLTPEDRNMNRDVGIEIPGCWKLKLIVENLYRITFKHYKEEFDHQVQPVLSSPSSNGYFLDSCFVHCQTIENDDVWSKYAIEGRTIAQSFGDWYFDRSADTRLAEGL